MYSEQPKHSEIKPKIIIVAKNSVFIFIQYTQNCVLSLSMALMFIEEGATIMPNSTVLLLGADFPEKSLHCLRRLV